MTEKIMAYQKCFIGPLVWKCFTNDFELLLPRWRQSAPKWHGKIMAYQKIFIGPLVWKCSTNNFERKLEFENFSQGQSAPKWQKKWWLTKKCLLAHWFENVPQMMLSYFGAKTKIWSFLPRWSHSAPKWHKKWWRTKRFLLAHWFGNVPKIILS